MLDKTTLKRYKEIFHLIQNSPTNSIAFTATDAFDEDTEDEGIAFEATIGDALYHIELIPHTGTFHICDMRKD